LLPKKKRGFPVFSSNLSTSPLLNPPRKRDCHPEIPSPNRFRPEDFRHYKKWGFAIYRTYHGPESDHSWSILLQSLRQQTTLSIGYYESDDAEELWKRTRIGTMVITKRGKTT
jgi:hypothetical protein